jgi:hypothetical protein
MLLLCPMLDYAQQNLQSEMSFMGLGQQHFGKSEDEESELTAQEQERAFQIFRQVHIDCILGKRSNDECESEYQKLAECCNGDQAKWKGYLYRLKNDPAILDIDKQQRNKK